MQQEADIIIIGGGLAGLTAAIHLAKSGQQIILIEPQGYPKHKVCGEYISNEVLPYLQSLDIDVEQLAPSHITQLQISTQEGKLLQSELPLGGFGVSRYKLDHLLYTIALKNKVQIIKSKVIEVNKVKNKYECVTADQRIFTSTFVIGAYGKQSKLDTTLTRDFNTTAPWLAVKGHYTGQWKEHHVALHNFKGGYCGISAVEDDRINVCYLAHYDSFKKYKNITDFQEHVLYRNPYLKQFFSTATPLFKTPLTISQVNFAKKKTTEKGIFMIGDSAGLIHPLCGNGMAMAIQSAQLLCTLLLQNSRSTSPKSQAALAQLYTKQWNDTFAKRIRAGRSIQKIITHKGLQQCAYSIAKLAPQIVPKIIRQTHGNPISC